MTSTPVVSPSVPVHLHVHLSIDKAVDASTLAENIRAAVMSLAGTQLVPVSSAAPAAAPANAQAPAVFPDLDPAVPGAYRGIAEQNLRQLKEGAIPDQGWGSANVLRAIAELPVETRKVLVRAIENGGHITRAEVYEVLRRTPDQSLKGFTRPVNRLAESLLSRGEITGGAEPLLHPIYNQKSKTYQQAQGFHVPVQVVHLYFKQKGI